MLNIHFTSAALKLFSKDLKGCDIIKLQNPQLQSAKASSYIILHTFYTPAIISYVTHTLKCPHPEGIASNANEHRPEKEKFH